MTNQIRDILRLDVNQRRNVKDQLTDVETYSATLCNVDGFISGVSLHNNGNQVYAGLGGTTDALGNVSFTRVVRAWLDNPNVTGQPGESVRLKYNRARNQWRVDSLDAEGISASGGSMQYYNHLAPNRLYIDSGFILNFLAKPVISNGTSTLVEVKPSSFYANGTYYDFAGAQVDLSSYAATTGNHSILQLWYDPNTNGIQFTQSTEQSIATAFDVTDYRETLTGNYLSWLPLAAFEMNENSGTIIDDSNLLRDNRPIYTLPNSASYGFPNPVTFGVTVTQNHQVLIKDSLILDEGGSVSLGEGAALILFDAPPNNVTTVTTVTAATYTVVSTDEIIKVDASSNTVTITLPDASTVSGYTFNIKIVDLSNLVTVNTTSSQTIDGSTSISSFTLYDNMKVVSDGSNWSII